MIDYQIGDVVECVNSGVIYCGKNYHLGINVRKGILYRAVGFRILKCGCLSLTFEGPLLGRDKSGLAMRFRKLEKGSNLEELITQQKNKELVDA